MKVIDPGHTYALQNLDVRQSNQAQPLVFVKRCNPPEKYPGNFWYQAGTTMQEVLRALIDRIQYVNKQKPDPTNKLVLRAYREALILLELRAAGTHGRTIALSPEQREHIEELSSCEKCGHIFPAMHEECKVATT